MVNPPRVRVYFLFWGLTKTRRMAWASRCQTIGEPTCNLLQEKEKIIQMRFNFLLALSSIIMGSIVLIIGLYLKNKPTKIGHINGFRNKHSMKNQEQWDFSQKVFAENLLRHSWIPFLTSVLGFFVNEQNTLWGLWGVLTSFLVCMTLVSFKTREIINSKFDRKDNG